MGPLEHLGFKFHVFDGLDFRYVRQHYILHGQHDGKHIRIDVSDLHRLQFDVSLFIFNLGNGEHHGDIQHFVVEHERIDIGLDRFNDQHEFLVLLEFLDEFGLIVIQ